MNTCVPVTNLVTELGKKKKMRKKYLQKLAKAKATSSTQKKRRNIRGKMDFMDIV